jgi:hypothetical protein
MNDVEYRRLVSILTVRACRALKVFASKGDDWILAAGKSPPTMSQERSSSGVLISFSSRGRPRSWRLS